MARFLDGKHAPHAERLIGHISDTLEIVTQRAVRYLAFRLAEVPEHGVLA